MSRAGIILVHACKNYITQLAQRKKHFANNRKRPFVTIKLYSTAIQKRLLALSCKFVTLILSVNVVKP